MTKKIFSFALVFILSSCSLNSRFSKIKEFDYIKNKESLNRIFSNRSIQNGFSVFILKLKNPALLEKLKTDKLSLVIDQNLLKSIEAEQNQVMNDLKDISSDIIILNQFKKVLNAIVVLAPDDKVSAIQNVNHILSVNKNSEYQRPLDRMGIDQIGSVEKASGSEIIYKNTFNFLGVDFAYQQNITGKKIKVGVVDSGIDFTHSMFGGPGDKEIYKKLNPKEKNNFFPNLKIVGGYDFVGSDYDPSSPILALAIPVPDENPIDESGHGTHVAGTIAGMGDAKSLFDGVAKNADLYALKVFGNSGTSDQAVIAALEWAVDPNNDNNLSDRLDVLNLSLGSNYGSVSSMYSVAIKNLSNIGIAVVASAGNAGDSDYIVGAPAVVDEAISVAASLDDNEANWKFNAIEFKLGTRNSYSEFVESPIAKKIQESDESFNLPQNLFYIGLANENLNEIQKGQLKGKVALIDRGQNTFYKKMSYAEINGAIAVVMVNNDDTPPFYMGGEEGQKIGIPAVMISKKMGNEIKEILKQQEVSVLFRSSFKIEKPELIDTIAAFSSKGPRFEDMLIKPEITAPGSNIISAKMGSGNEAVKMSGTSMSAPVVTGVIALLKEKYPELTVAELKSLLMGSAKSLVDDQKKGYSISRMGAGRVQIDKLFKTQMVSNPSAMSLGSIELDQFKVISKTLNFRNLSPEDKEFRLVFEGPKGIQIKEQNLIFNPKEEKQILIDIEIDGRKFKESNQFVEGFIKLYGHELSERKTSSMTDKNGEDTEQELFRVPVLGVIHKVSNLRDFNLKVFSTSDVDSRGAKVTLDWKNSVSQSGSLLAFNLLGTDSRKQDPNFNGVNTRNCDLKAVGYTIVGSDLYIGVKLYDQVTSWKKCEPTVLFDSNGDGQPDQELVGTEFTKLEGLEKVPGLKGSGSLLLDFKLAQKIRAKYEDDLKEFLKKETQKISPTPDDKKAKKNEPPQLSYLPAVMDIQSVMLFENSSVAVLKVGLDKIIKNNFGFAAIKVVTQSYERYSYEGDDFLENKYFNIDLNSESQSFIFNKFIFNSDDNKVTFKKGNGDSKLMLLMPNNRPSFGYAIDDIDYQFQILNPSYVRE